jgi:hypothetical protein
MTSTSHKITPAARPAVTSSSSQRELVALSLLLRGA